MTPLAETPWRRDRQEIDCYWLNCGNLWRQAQNRNDVAKLQRALIATEMAVSNLIVLLA
jgi:hypothetical protein